MDYRAAFKKMMEEMGIKATEIARVSGVQERQISLFVNGKDLTTATFFKMLDGAEQLKPGAKAKFFSHVVAVPVTPSPQLLVKEMDSMQLSQLLNAIAERFSQETSKSTVNSTASISA